MLIQKRGPNLRTEAFISHNAATSLLCLRTQTRRTGGGENKGMPYDTINP
jgi:hypothetical protein